MHYAPAIAVLWFHEDFLTQGSCGDMVQQLWSFHFCHTFGLTILVRNLNVTAQKLPYALGFLSLFSFLGEF